VLLSSPEVQLRISRDARFPENLEAI
jgi:hypothetical protein